MFRNVLRTCASGENALQYYLHRCGCALTKSRPFMTRSAPSARKQTLQRPAVKAHQNKFSPKKIHSPLLFSGILSFLGLSKEEEEEPPLIMAIKRGVLAMQRGQFDKAERTLHEALKLAHEESNEDGITYVYDVLANLALDTGQFEKSEKLFLNVMQRLLGNGYEANDNKIIHISLKLARIYENTDNSQKAEIGYEYCINNLQDKVAVASDDIENNQDTLKLWVMTLDNYGRYLVSQNRPSEAMSNFQKAYDMSVLVNGKEHEETALLLNDLGTTSNILGDVDAAVKYIEEAVELGQNITDMEHLPIIYINLGYVYIAKEMYDTARVACQRGLRLARRDEDEENIEQGKECLKKIDELLKGNKT